MVYKTLLIMLLALTNVFAAKNLKMIESLQANFIQKVENSSSKTIEYKGKILIKSSGKALWKYETPIVKNVYVLDTLVIVDEPELEQAIYTNLDNSINLAKLIEDAIEVEKDIYKSNLYERDYFLNIIDNKIKSLKFQDELGNRVTIDFLNVLQNSKIDDETFRFIPPDYYDIIKK